MASRIVALIDMDCFYAQIEQRLRPELYGTPIAVSQVTGTGVPGLLLAVSYEARAFGVKRSMTVADAKRVCPTLTVCSVPVMESIQKADLTRYRAASEEVFNVFNEFPNIVVEKASVDEAYLDLTMMVNEQLAESALIQTDNDQQQEKNKYDTIIKNLIENVETIFPSTFLADGTDLANDGNTVPTNYDRIVQLKQWIDEVCRKDVKQLSLAVGAKITEEIRTQIKTKTQFHCSAGIAMNKMIAKLICSRHKPKQQTIITQNFIAKIYDSTPISSVRNLGGKLGYALSSTFGVKTMGELALIPHEELCSYFADNAARLKKIIAGEDDEPVKNRLEPKSIAVSKSFPSKNALTTVGSIQSWSKGLATELSKRLYEDQIKYQRTARNIVVGFVTNNGTGPTKTCPLNDYRPDTIYSLIWTFIRMRGNSSTNENLAISPITLIQMSASKFESGIDSRVRQITSWFRSEKSAPSNNNEENDNNETSEIMVVNIVDKPKHDENSLNLLPVSEQGDQSNFNEKNSFEKVLSDENNDSEIIFLHADNSPVRLEAIFSKAQPLTINNNNTLSTKGNSKKNKLSVDEKSNRVRRKSSSKKFKTSKVEKRNEKKDVLKISKFFTK